MQNNFLPIYLGGYLTIFKISGVKIVFKKLKMGLRYYFIALFVAFRPRTPHYRPSLGRR